MTELDAVRWDRADHPPVPPTDLLLERVDSTSRVRMLVLPASGSLSELLRGCPAGLVYSNEEQRHCGRRHDLTGWAGRLAAKLAVADVLGLDAERKPAPGQDAPAPLGYPTPAVLYRGLAEIQILPQRQGFCTEGPGCLKPHPPQVRLSGAAAAAAGDTELQVSISHTRVRAIALAVLLLERSVEAP